MPKYQNRQPSNKLGKRNFGMTNLEIRQADYDQTLGKDSKNSGAYTRPGSNKK